MGKTFSTTEVSDMAKCTQRDAKGRCSADAEFRIICATADQPEVIPRVCFEHTVRIVEDGLNNPRVVSVTIVRDHSAGPGGHILREHRGEDGD